MPRMKITQQDIADALKLSRVTVSKAFNGKPLSSEIKEAILDKALELGYLNSKFSFLTQTKPNIIPEQSKTASRLMLICFSANHPSDPSCNGASNRWQKMIKGMERACNTYNSSLIVTILADNNENIKQLLKYYTLGSVDGMILTGDGLKIEAFLQGVGDDKPIVIADANYEHDVRAHIIINFDVQSAMNGIVKHFVDAGHRRVAYVDDANNRGYMNDRRSGMLSGCAQYGIAVDETFAYSGDGAWQEHFAEKISMGGKLPTAFICESDAVAMEVKSILERKGYRVPGDFCVSGFDSTSEESLANNIITTVYYREELGFTAIEQLLSRIKNPNSPALFIKQRIKIVIHRPLLTQTLDHSHPAALHSNNNPAPAGGFSEFQGAVCAYK